jgi:glutamate 5-kinase
MSHRLFGHLARSLVASALVSSGAFAADTHVRCQQRSEEMSCRTVCSAIGRVSQ